MKCRLCKLLCNWLCGPEFAKETDEFWSASRRWERDHSNQWDLWMADSQEVRQRNEHANEVFETDQRRAFEMRRELADKGSEWAMRAIGRQYELAQGVERDLAQAERYYYQALLAGSWMATLDLAKLLFDHRINEKWEGILENGAESNFIPAHFWLAWYRFKREPGMRAARKVSPLMEKAAEAGHPGARITLARWKAQGRLGLREMRQGFREFRALWSDFRAGRLRDWTHGTDVVGANCISPA